MHFHSRLLAVLVLLASLGPASAQNTSHCETSCGNVTIKYPFGSGEGCYHSPDFLVTCDRSNGNPTPYYLSNESGAVITNMSTSTGVVRWRLWGAHDCYNNLGNNTNHNDASVGILSNSSFRISTKNSFVAIGCDTYAYISGTIGNESESTSSGCITSCGRDSRIINGSCSGIGCCEISIPQGMSLYELLVGSFYNHTNITDLNPCSHAFVVNGEKFNFSSTNLLDFGSKEKMPVLLDWAIGNLTCKTVDQTSPDFLCQGQSECHQSYAGPGYRCRCLKGFEVNPYFPNTCTDIDECARPDHGCVHHCVNSPGNYTCTCRKGYSGDGKKGGSGCTADSETSYRLFGYDSDPRESHDSLTKEENMLSASIAIILLLLFISWVYLGVQKRKAILLREKFFKKNGGIMLQQRLSRDGGSQNQEKVHFTKEELKKATDNYDESRIIGKGGYGTVYKGILSDNRIVAIKKSKLADQNEKQIEQFINEVVILSQINHRNVVKLIGCCLETDVPSLVYEFIPNGTLCDHIHNESKSLAFTWDIRLRIATETARALSYLHSAASVPIVHRDVKPMNILLDNDFVAKVADFGASKRIPMDQIDLATIVQGTLGYLDPEYLQTNQLTDKSDVYSFGVVLVELFTGRKALSYDRPEKDRNLAIYFLSSLKEGRLFQVLDEHLNLNEVPNEIIQVSRLAERCLCVKGDERPSMKEVAIELEGVLASMEHKHPWVKSTSNDDEVVHLLKQAAEDYEYTDKANGSSRTFDSMSKQTILPIASGR